MAAIILLAVLLFVTPAFAQPASAMDASPALLAQLTSPTAADTAPGRNGSFASPIEALRWAMPPHGCLCSTAAVTRRVRLVRLDCYEDRGHGIGEERRLDLISHRFYGDGFPSNVGGWSGRQPRRCRLSTSPNVSGNDKPHAAFPAFLLSIPRNCAWQVHVGCLRGSNLGPATGSSSRECCYISIRECLLLPDKHQQL